MKRMFLIGMVSVALAATPALAGHWQEIPDAPDGPIPYQVTDGIGPLDTISGATNSGAGDYVDAYCISITDVAAFHATTCSGCDPNASCSWDTRLYLADLDGNFLLANDDCPLGHPGYVSYLSDPSTFPGNLYNDPPSLAPGGYVLMITGFSNEPRDANDSNLFSTSPWDALHGVDPLAGPFDHWENAGYVDSGEYTIGLAGATFCVPEPGTLSLLALAGLAVLRRRR